MAEKTQKSESKEEIQGNLSDPTNIPQASSQPKLPGKQKPISDPLLEFLSQKERALGQPISDRLISLLRREISKNPNQKIEEIWRRIYG